MSWIARISTNMQEIKFIFNPTISSHIGASNFLSSNYDQIKRFNPRLPVMVRPHADTPKATMTCRYDYGGRIERDITGKSAEEIRSELEKLVGLGEHFLKADLYPWQESYQQDDDIVDYDPQNPHMHHV